MKTWLDLEARFRGFAHRLQYARLDDQTGAAGEHWRIAGGFDRVAEKEFETLSMLAGSLLIQTQSKNQRFAQILSKDDPTVSWYRALKHLSGAHSPGTAGYQSNEKGENLVWIFTGSINNNIAEVAANVCLYLHANFPQKKPWHEKIYQEYGKEIIIGLVLALASAFIGLWLK